MPTENRSSNTENAPCPFCGGQVDPEGWLRGDGVRGPECESCGATAPTIGVWNSVKPAEQHQGEPVAWRAAISGNWQVFSAKQEAEQELADWLSSHSPEEMAEAHADGLCNPQPLYTRADPGEVDRLSAQLHELAVTIHRRHYAKSAPDFKPFDFASGLIGQIDNMVAGLLQDVSILRAQLAKADTLLCRAYRVAPPELGRDIQAVLSVSAEPSAPVELGPWLPLSAPGQIQEGDWLCFTVSGSFICAQARLIICPGTDKEEIVYNRKKNHYFCTDMAIAGTSNHKGVLVARAAL